MVEGERGQPEHDLRPAAGQPQPGRPDGLHAGEGNAGAGRAGGPPPGLAAQRDSGGRVEEPDLSPADEAALERLWARVPQEGVPGDAEEKAGLVADVLAHALDERALARLLVRLGGG